MSYVLVSSFICQVINIPIAVGIFAASSINTPTAVGITFAVTFLFSGGFGGHHHNMCLLHPKSILYDY